jgi:hypothetical protein
VRAAAVILAVASLFPACGDTNKYEMTVEGTVTGTAFLAGSGAYDTVATYLHSVVLIEGIDLCSMATTGTIPSDIQILTVSFCKGPEEKRVECGIVGVEDPPVHCNQKEAWAELRGMSGATPTTVRASSGTVVAEGVDGAFLFGHVDLTFAGAGTLSGKFVAPYCSGLSP